MTFGGIKKLRIEFHIKDVSNGEVMLPFTVEGGNLMKKISTNNQDECTMSIHTKYKGLSHAVFSGEMFQIVLGSTFLTRNTT